MQSQSTKVTHSETLFLIDHDWNDAFRAVLDYTETNKDEITINTVHHGVSIGIWCRLQCKLRELGRLPESRITLLEAANFDFEMIKQARDKSDYLTCSHEEKIEIWNDHFDCVQRYIQETGRGPQYNTEYEGRKIGPWLSAQKTRYNKLHGEKKKKFDTLKLYVDSAAEAQWKISVELIKNFIAEKDRFPREKELYRGIAIGKWVKSQKDKYRNGSICNEKIRELEALGLFEKFRAAA